MRCMGCSVFNVVSKGSLASAGRIPRKEVIRGAEERGTVQIENPPGGSGRRLMMRILTLKVSGSNCRR